MSSVSAAKRESIRRPKLERPLPGAVEGSVVAVLTVSRAPAADAADCATIALAAAGTCGGADWLEPWRRA